jgi:DNA-directed RNA polymerase specialized sigma24 family protein
MNFPSTHWSVLGHATRSGGDRADAALEELCSRYWNPVFQALRYRGYSEPEAEDLTQEFLLQLTDNSAWRRADPNRGRFRSFLLGALSRFLREVEVRRRALKRGGDVAHVSADEPAVSETLPAGGVTEDLERSFDRNWAVSLLGRALDQTRQQYAAAGKAHLFTHLKSYLPAGKEPPTYEYSAATLGITLAALKTEIHRLRLSFKASVRAEVAQTVSAPHEVDAELAWLQAVLFDRGSPLDDPAERRAPAPPRP